MIRVKEWKPEDIEKYQSLNQQALEFLSSLPINKYLPYHLEDFVGNSKGHNILRYFLKIGDFKILGNPASNNFINSSWTTDSFLLIMKQLMSEEKYSIAVDENLLWYLLFKIKAVGYEAMDRKLQHIFTLNMRQTLNMFMITTQGMTIQDSLPLDQALIAQKCELVSEIAQENLYNMSNDILEETQVNPILL